MLPPQERSQAAQDALRRADDDGALSYLRERQEEAQDLVERVAKLHTWLSLGPSHRRVADCDHNVNGLAVLMNANPQYDSYMTRLLFSSLPLQGDYFVTSPGGAHVANALIEPHMRDTIVNTMQLEKIAKRSKGLPVCLADLPGRWPVDAIRQDPHVEGQAVRCCGIHTAHRRRHYNGGYV